MGARGASDLDGSELGFVAEEFAKHLRGHAYMLSQAVRNCDSLRVRRRKGIVAVPQLQLSQRTVHPKAPAIGRSLAASLRAGVQGSGLLGFGDRGTLWCFGGECGGE